jgi:hypothetical protein
MEVVIESGLRVRDEIVLRGNWPMSVPRHRPVDEVVGARSATRALLGQGSADVRVEARSRSPSTWHGQVLARWGEGKRKVPTGEGICGWGEPVVERRAKTVETAVSELNELLVGEDPFVPRIPGSVHAQTE